MQLKTGNLASASCTSETAHSKNFKENTETPICSHNIKEVSKMVIMSGTAKRNSFGKTSALQEAGNGYKKHYREGFLKLRTPYHKSRQKLIHPEEKLMNRSCEILFQYLKPYKDIQMIKGRNPQKKEWNRTIGSILKTTNIVYEKTATRKVEILSVFEENPKYGCNKETSIFDFLPNENLFEHCDPGKKYKNLVPDKDSQARGTIHALQKTFSSEDFITNAFL